MSDEQIEVKPLHLTRRMVLTVDEWPARTAFTEAFLQQSHQHGMAVEGDTVRFRLGNGEATYVLRRDLPKHGWDGIVAELVEGTSKASLASRRRKYETGG